MFYKIVTVMVMEVAGVAAVGAAESKQYSKTREFYLFERFTKL